MFAVSSGDEDVHGMLSSLHGACFRQLSTKLKECHEGLTVAARQGRRQGIITAGLAKRLERLDIAVAYTRHASRPKLQKFLAEFEQQLNGGQKVEETTAEKTTSATPAAATNCVEPLESIAPCETRKRLTTKTTLSSTTPASSGKGDQPPIDESVNKEATAEEEERKREKEKSKGAAAATAALAATATAALAVAQTTLAGVMQMRNKMENNDEDNIVECLALLKQEGELRAEILTLQQTSFIGSMTSCSFAGRKPSPNFGKEASG